MKQRNKNREIIRLNREGFYEANKKVILYINVRVAER